jgi:hypothetical protein
MSSLTQCIEIKPTAELKKAITEFNKLIPDKSNGGYMSRLTKQYGGRSDVFCRRLAKIITFAILASGPATLYLSGVAGAGSVYLTQLFKDYIGSSEFVQRTFIEPNVAIARSRLEDVISEDVGICSTGWLNGSIDVIKSWGSSLFGGNDCNQKNLMYINRLDEIVAEVKSQLETKYAETASMPTLGLMSMPLVERIKRYSINLNSQVYNILKSSGLCDERKATESELEIAVKQWIAGSIGPDDLRASCGLRPSIEMDEESPNVTDVNDEENAKMLLEMRLLAELENYEKLRSEDPQVWETAHIQGEELTRKANGQIEKIKSYNLPINQEKKTIGGIIRKLRTLITDVYNTAMRSTPERSPLRKSFSDTMSVHRTTPELSSEYFSQELSPMMDDVDSPSSEIQAVHRLTQSEIDDLIETSLKMPKRKSPEIPVAHRLNQSEIDELIDATLKITKRKRSRSRSRTRSRSRSTSSREKHTRHKRKKGRLEKESKIKRKTKKNTKHSKTKKSAKD